MQRKAVALLAIKDASAFLKKEFQMGRKGTRKNDGTFVSESDYGSEKRIIRALRKAFPDDAILSEERGELRGKNEYRWILDPLDGTHNFLAGIPIFGILLALEKKGEIVMSFCVFPLANEVFTAQKSKGAFLNGKRIHVSGQTSLRGGMVLGDPHSGLPFNVIANDMRPFHAAGARFRLLGCGPFTLTRVALGTACAAVMRAGKAWDIAAPCLLVEEAGGKVTDFEGNRWSLEPQSLVATNGRMHLQALRMLA
ncbi:MAG: myo-inositol-1(or 4)-monophosphatase [Candidatus Peregrinibacteria bacterium Greene0416_19]|nr:MAG: myo-inositol-1(or 4)-monophosphatase [Candidatus Peregrinibacteria bacterium Greene0416_19]